MIIFILILIFPCVIYFGNMLLGNIGLLKLKQKRYRHYEPFVSIIIAARNEEKHIGETLECVLNQQYPGDKYEVVLVNDASIDGTTDIAGAYMQKYGNLRIVNQPEKCPYGSRKKYALKKGIEQARGEILLFTDADSTMSDRWIKTIAGCYDPEGTIGGVCSFVCLPHKSKDTPVMRFQELDYIALSLLCAGYFGLGYPACNNGNNFSYRKSLFLEVGGFDGIEHVASGDDDLLLEKFATLTDKKIVYCSDPDSIVETAPAPTTKALLNQRSRWASKVFVYKRLSYTIIMLGIFLFNLILCLAPLFIPFFGNAAFLFISLFIGKLTVDGLLVLPRLKKLNRLRLKKGFVLLELLHPFYIVYIGISGVLSNFIWKQQGIGSFVKSKYVKEPS
ncbi:MAG: glycosyltransferase [Spirochaetales bacterium]|nr:glycosyltransferase [Spirochaetales bacterium]